MRHPLVSDEQYFARVKAKTVETATGCWIWQGFIHKPPRNYGETYCRGKKWRTHRLMYRLKHGPIPDGMLVMHTCDNPPCCNPDHLRLGTHLENMRECREKDRYYYANLTHCKRGHEFTPENTGRYYPEKQLRACKACQRGKLRIKAGWPEDLAYSLPATPHGHRPFGKKWARRVTTSQPPEVKHD